MATYVNNLVFRACRLLLLALFLAPCIVCGDSAASVVSGPHAAGPLTIATNGAGSHWHASHPAPDCACLSDSSKVRGDAPVWTPVIAEGVLPAFSWRLPEPEAIPVRPVVPAPLVQPILACEATSDRAPPIA